MNSNVATEAEALFQRALSVYQRSKLVEAKMLCEAALELRPRNFKALQLLGVIAAQSNDAARAIELFERAILLNPRNEAAHNNLGNALASVNRFEAAVASYNKAIALNRRYADAFFNRGNALTGQQNHTAAIESFNKAIALENNYAEAYYNRGNAQVAVKSYELALKSYNRAIAINPGYAEAYSNRGTALKELDDLSGALASYDQAIALNSRYAEAHANRGAVLRELNDLSAALASYDQALAIRPDYPDAIYDRSLAYLLSGDFEKGWPGHEWRWRSVNASKLNEKRGFEQPLWLGGESLAGKTIRIYGEQGFGDRIQFSRYVKWLADLHARVILEVPRPLVKVLSRLEGLSQIVEMGAALPEFDYQCPLLTLPLAFNTTPSTIPFAKRYLSSDEPTVERWRAKLRGTRSPRIGLVWSGSKVHLNDRLRSIALADLMGVLPADFQYISLQKEVRDSDLLTLESSPNILDLSADLADFNDTAALCECMDLVLSVDTSVAHLSGALGKRTWILLPFAPDWRWLLGRDDCPWYGAVKLYRQQRRDDWSGVLEQINADLNSEFRNGVATR